MEWQQLMTDGYERVEQSLARTLEGLSREELDRQPNPECNTIGWLTWHLTRVQDHHISDLMGEEQIWIREGWCSRFGRAADPQDIGWGHTAEQVAAFRSPEPSTLLDYHRAVLARTKRFLGSLSAADLDRQLNEPWYQPLPTVGVRIVSILSDNLQHAGQAAYLRGFFRGKDR